MTKHRTSFSLALIAAYFIAMPVISEYIRLAYAGQFVFRIADFSQVLLLFCIVSLAGAMLFAITVRQEGGRWWAVVPLAILLLVLAVFGPLHQSSDVSLLATILLAPAVLLLLWAFPLRQGSLAWFGAIETGFFSLIDLLWVYGLFIAPPLSGNVRVDSPSLYEFAGTVYVYAGLPLLGILLLVLALWCWRSQVAIAGRSDEADFWRDA
ncbi:MAG: hypothetical protein KAW93_00450 [Methanogenium sp.]|nr:hypothetical protein [Methanogenium sp.]